MSPREFPEADWKRVKALYEKGLDRFCQDALQKAVAIAKDESLSAPERFRKLHDHMRSSNKDLAQVFDDTYRRSRAINLIYMLRDRELISTDDLMAFSEETRASLDRMLESIT